MHYVEPHAKLITHTINPVQVIYQGFKMCVTPLEPITFPPLPEMDAFIRKRLKAEHAHESVLEHASFTFEIVCSRATSHQFVRHRIASYSQQSQRYCAFDNLGVLVPETIKLDAACRERFEKLHAEVEDAYRFFLEHKIKPEDARSVLTEAQSTRFQVTMNARALRNFFGERLCRRAQREIRQIAWEMLHQCADVLPCVFDGIAEPCVKAGHCVEERPCGLAPWKA